MNKKKTIVLALIVMLLWGSLYPSVKFAYREFGISGAFIPDLLLFAGLRFVVSGGLISLVCKGKKTSMGICAAKDWCSILLMGVVAIGLHYACSYVGLSYTDSSKTALLKQLGVLFFICFSFLFVKNEKFAIKKIVAALLGLCGIVVLNVSSLQIRLGIGEILIIFASVFTVISNVICKKFCSKINPLWMTGLSQLAGGGILTVVGFLLGGRLNSCSLAGVGIAVYILFATVVSYAIWYTVVQKNDLSYLFIIKLSEPIFSAVIGAAILEENVFTLQYGTAFVLVALAVVISNIKTKNKRTAISS